MHITSCDLLTKIVLNRPEICALATKLEFFGVDLICDINEMTPNYVCLNFLNNGVDKLNIDNEKKFGILPAEFVGHASHREDGILRIGTPKKDGTGVVEIRLTKGDLPRWWSTNSVAVYIRRFEHDLSVAEIHIAQHDELFAEELDCQNEQASFYPMGDKEYWRSEMVGKYRYGSDEHLMTDEEFEDDWKDFEEMVC